MLARCTLLLTLVTGCVLLVGFMAFWAITGRWWCVAAAAVGGSIFFVSMVRADEQLLRRQQTQQATDGPRRGIHRRFAERCSHTVGRVRLRRSIARSRWTRRDRRHLENAGIDPNVAADKPPARRWLP